MIFTVDMAKLVRQGRKTQVRKLLGESNTCPFEAGRSYAVQPGRGRPAICRLTVMDTRVELLGVVSLKDVRREGFVTTDEFFEHYRWSRDVPVWVVSFALGDLTDAPRLLARRAGPPHGDYTHEPHLAMDGEPEAVSAGDVDRFSRMAFARDDRLRRERIRLAVGRLGEEVRSLRADLAEVGGVGGDVERSLGAVERVHRALARRVEDAA